MSDRMIASQFISLYDLCVLIREVVGDNFPEYIWVVAEIASIKENQNGHCYLELVDKNEEKVIAQARATIWAYNYRSLAHKFEKATGETLKRGMKILFSAQVQYHEVYGLSLNIRDIDPTYSTGEMARKKRETVERLLREGLLELNKSLLLPLVPQRIAIISSPTAAGYGDFMTHLQENSYGYRFSLSLFQALMQGEEASFSIIAALQKIKKQIDLFDLVVIIRGGGSQIDLSCFDDYELSAGIARFPLPVVTGIGHERDDTVVDMVAHTKKKTPTAVAEFIISGVRLFETQIEDLQNSIIRYSDRLLENSRYSLQENLNTLNHILKNILSYSFSKHQLLVIRFCLASRKNFSDHQNRLSLVLQKVNAVFWQKFQEAKNKYFLLEQSVYHFNPVNLMKRGFSVARINGNLLTSIKQAKSGQTITTQLLDGLILSKVEDES